MNNTENFSSMKSMNCEGKCILEMQKNLDSEVISEFLKTIRDFHNDAKTSTELKNIIISETNKVIELIKEKAIEMSLFVDEIFLNRRRRQSSFYHLCHKLARKTTDDGSNLPDESKCICFSDENLKKFEVDPAADSNLKLISNFELLKDDISQIYGEIQCAKCKKFSQLSSSTFTLNADFMCDCTVPSINSQHKILEAILDLCESKEPSIYLTHLKRDAEYYRKKTDKLSGLSDAESVESFEVILPENAYSSLSTYICKQGDVAENDDRLLETDIFGKNTFETNDNSSNDDLVKKPTNSDNSEKPRACVDTKSTPADIVKQSFNKFFTKSPNYSSNLKFNKTHISPVASKSQESIENLSARLKFLNRDNNISIDSVNKENINNTLKFSLSSYFEKDKLNDWLRK